jgi:hypothetical protein
VAAKLELCGVDCEGAVGGDVEVGGGQEAAQDGVLKGERYAVLGIRVVG